MGNVVAREIKGIPSPKIALLNIGEEEIKASGPRYKASFYTLVISAKAGWKRLSEQMAIVDRHLSDVETLEELLPLLDEEIVLVRQSEDVLLQSLEPEYGSLLLALDDREISGPLSSPSGTNIVQRIGLEVIDPEPFDDLSLIHI